MKTTQQQLASAELAPIQMLSGRIIMLLLMMFLVWTYLAEIDEFAIAAGVVVPQEKLKLIQHLEGGIVEEIKVSEGDTVNRGQMLMRLNLGAAGISRDEKIAELDALLLTRSRLQAESDSLQPVFDEKIAARQSGLVSVELAVYQGRREEHEQGLLVRDKQIQQRKLEVSELKEKQRALKRDLVIQKQQVDVSDELLSKGLSSKIEYLQVLEKYEASRGEVAILRQTVPRVQAALDQALLEKQELKKQYQRRALDEQAIVERRIVRLTKLLTRVDDRQQRTSVRSPIHGVVKRMRHTTLGGVVKPGEVIMEIVPISDNLVIEAKLSPVDRGYVRVGQQAIVKVTTYDYARYGGLKGTVSRIGADSQKDPDTGIDYFEVIVKTDKIFLGDNPKQLRITPGMEAIVEINTGSRSVMSYLIAPVLKIRDESFRER